MGSSSSMVISDAGVGIFYPIYHIVQTEKRCLFGWESKEITFLELLHLFLLFNPGVGVDPGVGFAPLVSWQWWRRRFHEGSWTCGKFHVAFLTCLPDLTISKPWLVSGYFLLFQSISHAAFKIWLFPKPFLGVGWGWTPLFKISPWKKSDLNLKWKMLCWDTAKMRAEIWQCLQMLFSVSSPSFSASSWALPRDLVKQIWKMPLCSL